MFVKEWNIFKNISKEIVQKSKYWNAKRDLDAWLMIPNIWINPTNKNKHVFTDDKLFISHTFKFGKYTYISKKLIWKNPSVLDCFKAY